MAQKLLFVFLLFLAACTPDLAPTEVGEELVAPATVRITQTIQQEETETEGPSIVLATTVLNPTATEQEATASPIPSETPIPTCDYDAFEASLTEWTEWSAGNFEFGIGSAMANPFDEAGACIYTVSQDSSTYSDTSYENAIDYIEAGTGIYILATTPNSNMVVVVYEEDFGTNLGVQAGISFERLVPRGDG